MTAKELKTKQTIEIPDEENGNPVGKEGMLSNEELSNLYEQSFKVLEEGKIVEGTIISKDEKGMIVDVGYKSEGFVAKEEFRDYDKVKVGDKINVMIEEKENEDGIIVLSKLKADRSLNWEKTISSCEEGKILRGKIFRKVKGGLMVDIGMEAFLPASQIDVKHIFNMDDYVGKEYDFKIIKIN
ncbi:MAG: S1 RNA-binding domain-containing protein, partial [bacterium]|nr:S1 RNA-binding domain-containing protein [bacterium]